MIRSMWRFAVSSVPARAGRILCALLALCAASHPAAGDEPAGRRQRLEATLNDWQSLRAGFVQTVVGDDDAVIERSRGEVSVMRPGRFRWRYEVPFSQLIVSGGAEVFIYDEDLEQVTVGTIDGTTDDPAARLLEDRVPIDELFELGWLDPAGGLEWARLTPRAAGATYRHVDVGMRDSELAALRLADRFGQTTIIEFEDLERDPALDPSRFEFSPPAGVDVVRMAE